MQITYERIFFILIDSQKLEAIAGNFDARFTDYVVMCNRIEFTKRTYNDTSGQRV